jgi:hypothetical protein
MAARLTDEQRKKTLSTGNTSVVAIDATVSQKLLLDVEMLELPNALKREIPAVSKLKYVRASDRIVLVDPPPNRIVVAEIKRRGARHERLPMQGAVRGTKTGPALSPRYTHRVAIPNRRLIAADDAGIAFRLEGLPHRRPGALEDDAASSAGVRPLRAPS